VEDIRSRIETDGVEFIYAMFVEMHGKPCAKLVPVEALDGLMADGAGFAGFAAGPMGQDPSAPDILAIPDPASYTQLPWQPNVAVMQCDPTVEGELWPYAPRVILRTALESLAERNLVLKSGFEAEYSLVARGDDGTIRVADPLDTDPRPCYDARLLTRMLPHLTEVSKHMNTMGWENYANDHEDANGQFEQNWKYSDAMTTADRLILFRFMVHTLAQRDGRFATFMPKPFADRTGNGLHAHMSLWTGDTDEPLFPARDTDSKGLGLSELAYQFTAGLLANAESLVAVACPIVNSYKRMGVGAPTSGATWAPAYAAYGGNNRTHMLRVPKLRPHIEGDGGGHGPYLSAARLECRAVDPAMNPYLAAAMMLAAGLEGIENDLDPGDPIDENMYLLSDAQLRRRGVKLLPRTLLEAIEAFADDPLSREVMGKELCDAYVELKTGEWWDYHNDVPPWEIDQYLTKF